MTTFETSVVIARPLEDVFAFTTDISNNTKWQKILVDAGLTRGETMDVGATYRYTVKFMGKRIETEAVVTAFEENRAFSAKTLRGPVTGEFHLAFEPVYAGTALTTRCKAELGYFKYTKPIALRLAKEQYRKDLDALKHILEASPDDGETLASRQ
ncbi:SRPBCC family protein [uncultured Desulfosarcina sp.]|uniref:SRPBCC family protein n=1 Tax=uncultured Desulfosarcina sp. TaxID=218289 RepID=UPI0029C7EDF3|nr:SRPBCC family protein [uncultured Desulfosarcina sp.]